MGVEIDFAKAFEYYNFAADKGHLSAIACQASMCEEGRGTEKDTKKAQSLHLLFKILSDKFLNGDY